MTKSHRQRYGFGSFIKKITRPVKKVAKKVWKSPLGKAALLGGGLYGLGSLAGGQGGWSNFGALGKMFGKKRLLGNLLYSGEGAKRKLSLGKMGLMGLLGAGATLPFLGDDEEEIVEEGWENTPASIANITAMARNRDSSLNFMPQSPYVQSGFYAADGGIARLANGGGVAEAKAEQMLKMEYQKYRNQGGTMSYQRFKMMVLQQAQSQGPMAQGQPQMAPQMAAHGGRIGYQRGGPPGGGDRGMRGTGQSFGSSYGPGRDTGWSPGVGGTQHIPTHQPTQPTLDRFPDRGIRDINPQINLPPTADERYRNLINFKTNWGSFLPGGKPFRYNAAQKTYPNYFGTEYDTETMQPIINDEEIVEEDTTVTSDPSGTQNLGVLHPNAVTGARILSNQEKKDKRLTELMNMAEGGRVGAQEGGLMSLGGMEKDYRQEGGFVPLGKEEKADDVPARLSKNEFVFTADAVKAAGGGDIDAGAEVMQNMMTNLEEGGEISEESQGAQGMYNQQQMLQSRMA